MNPEAQDWIDRVVARDGTWEPPPGFVTRVAVQGMALRAIPLRQRTVRDLVESVRVRLDGPLWVLRQYRELLFGHL